MKKAICIMLTLVLACSTCAALADTFDTFQPYTDVDLSVLKNAGYTSSFNNYQFNAEFYPKSDTISGTYSYSSWSDDLTIKMDIKAIYSGGSCVLIPRLIFSRYGRITYYFDRMADIYIVNGENRYHVDLTGVSRSSDSKYSTATDQCVEPMYATGIFMLQDLAYSDQTIQVNMDGMDFTLTDADKQLLKDFYDTCKEAGIFDQPALASMSDDYYVITLFNEGSSGTENVQTEEAPVEEGEEEADAA